MQIVRDLHERWRRESWLVRFVRGSVLSVNSKAIFKALKPFQKAGLITMKDSTAEAGGRGKGDWVVMLITPDSVYMSRNLLFFLESAKALNQMLIQYGKNERRHYQAFSFHVKSFFGMQKVFLAGSGRRDSSAARSVPIVAGRNGRSDQ